jgi:hypothetical protein
MTVGKHLTLGRVALIAAMSIGVPGAAHAALVTESFSQSYSVPPGTGTFTQDLSFQQFDSNLGLLQSITVDLAGSGYAILNLYNFNAFGVTYTGANTNGNIQVSALGLTSLLSNVTTGTLSGTAVPGATTITSSTQSFDVNGGISAEQFAAYTGTGTATVTLAVGPFQASVTYGSPAHNSGTTFVGGDGNVDGTVSVTYTYDDSYAVPVPEPSTLAVFGTGIFLLGFLRRQRATAGGRNDLLPPGAAA